MSGFAQSVRRLVQRAEVDAVDQGADMIVSAREREAQRVAELRRLRDAPSGHEGLVAAVKRRARLLR